MQESEKPNKFVKPKRRSRNPNGQPRPYRDGNRWKAPGSFVDGLGQTHKVYGTGSTQAAALNKLAENIEKRKSELALSQLPRELVTVTAYCSHWLEEKAQSSRLSYKTKTGYKSALRKWIDPHLGQIRLNQLNKKHIDALFQTVAAAGLSRSVQVQIRSVLQPALKDAEDNGYISKSPFLNAKMLPKRSAYPDFYDIEEIKKLLAIQQCTSDWLRWQLALVFGLRQGEALGLRWCDLDLDAKYPKMHIRGQIQRQTGVGLVQEKLKTAKSVRSIPITPAVTEAFKELKQANDLALEVHGQAWNSMGYVFLSSTGTPRDAANDRKAWKKLVAAAGVRDLPLHSARHSAGTNAGDLNVASKMLGHSGIAVTADFYANVPLANMLESLEEVQRQLSA